MIKSLAADFKVLQRRGKRRSGEDAVLSAIAAG
jgi:hypothetical protein